MSESERAPAPILVNVATACRMVGIGRTTAFALIGAGQWEARKAGARTLVTVASIERWAESLPRRGSQSNSDHE
jgi:hypothetical protein